MASANPVATVLDKSNTLLQRFRVTTDKHLILDVFNTDSSGNVIQLDVDPGPGSVTNPSSLAAVKRKGLTLVYGVLNITVVEEGDKKVEKPFLARLSPTVSPFVVEGNKVGLGSNTAIAATSDEDDKGWVYAISKQTGSNAVITEYSVNYASNIPPNKNTLSITDVSETSRLGVAAIPKTGLQWDRLIAYQTPSKVLKARQLPGVQDDVIAQDDVKEQTPIAVTIKSVSGAATAFVYYISAANERLKRAQKTLPNGSWAVSTVFPDDSMDASSDLAATNLPTGGNYVTFMQKGNGQYSNYTDSV